MKIIPQNYKCKLSNCPVGLFLSATGTLCVMTEYMTETNKRDAYIVESGEYFWGGTGDTTSRANLLVTPCKVEKE